MSQGEGGGRPTKKPADLYKRVTKYAMAGFTNDEIADLFSVVRATFYNWLTEDQKLLDALRKGREDANTALALTMHKAAMGHTIKSEEIKVVSLGAGEGSQVERVPTKKYYPPDIQAAIFLLTNRDPKKWKRQSNVDVTTGDKPITGIDLSKLTDEEIALLASLEAKAKGDVPPPTE